MQRIVLVFIVVVLLVAGWRGAAHAQHLNPIDEKGKIVQIDIRSQKVLVQTGDGNRLIADLNEKRIDGGVQYRMAPCELKIKGTIPAKGLQRGMFVRFSAKLNKKRTATEPITEITVFTRDENSVFGASADDLGGGAFDQPEEGARPGDFKEGTYTVAGQITSARSSTISVTYPGDAGYETVKCRVDRDAVVNIEIADLQYATIGDDIHVKGSAPQRPRGQEDKVPHVFALEVTITKPVPEDEKKPRPPKAEPGEDGEQVAQADPPAGEHGEEAPGVPPLDDDDEPAGPRKGRVIRIN